MFRPFFALASILCAHQFVPVARSESPNDPKIGVMFARVAKFEPENGKLALVIDVIGTVDARYSSNEVVITLMKGEYSLIDSQMRPIPPIEGQRRLKSGDPVILLELRKDPGYDFLRLLRNDVVVVSIKAGRVVTDQLSSERKKKAFRGRVHEVRSETEIAIRLAESVEVKPNEKIVFYLLKDVSGDWAIGEVISFGDGIAVIRRSPRDGANRFKVGVGIGGFVEKQVR